MYGLRSIQVLLCFVFLALPLCLANGQVGSSKPNATGRGVLFFLRSVDPKADNGSTWPGGRYSTETRLDSREVYSIDLYAKKETRLTCAKNNLKMGAGIFALSTDKNADYVLFSANKAGKKTRTGAVHDLWAVNRTTCKSVKIETHNKPFQYAWLGPSKKVYVYYDAQSQKRLESKSLVSGLSAKQVLPPDTLKVFSNTSDDSPVAIIGKIGKLAITNLKQTTRVYLPTVADDELVSILAFGKNSFVVVTKATIWLVSPKKLIKLACCGPYGEYSDAEPALSPNNRYLAIHSANAEDPGTVGGNTSANHAISIVSTSGAEKIRHILVWTDDTFRQRYQILGWEDNSNLIVAEYNDEAANIWRWNMSGDRTLVVSLKGKISEAVYVRSAMR